MSYEPGTLLSIGAGASLEQVVVLSDGRVATKTFAGKPVERRDILSMSDWLLLATSDITVTSKTPALPPSPEPEPAPVSYAVGTMLRWIKDDQNKRVALVLKDGLLQVKEVINGACTRDERRCHGVKRTFFKDFAAWKASLPEGGAITAEANATKYTSSMEDKTKKPIVSTSDTGYLAELIKRFSVHSHIETNSSLAEATQKNRQKIKDELVRLTNYVSKGDSGNGNVQYTANQIAFSARLLSMNLRDAYGKNVDQMNRVSYNFKNSYRQKLFAYKGGLKYEIALTHDNGLLGLCPRPEGTYPFGEVTVFGKNFADLGIEMKSDGKPRLEVSYRRRRFEL